MIKGLFQKLLLRSGKQYEIDPRIPNALLLRSLYTRLLMLLRGYLKTGKKVFIGANTKLQNRRNIQFGRSVTIGSHCIIDAYASQPIIIGDGSSIGAYSKLTTTSHFSKYGKGLTMGSHSAVGDFTHFGASGGIEIGNDVIMGSYVSFHSENHVFDNPAVLIREQGVTSKGIRIGNNIWVGAKVTFLDGCIVGDHSVVAAGAVVNGHYPAHSIVGGVPAKVLKDIS